MSASPAVAPRTPEPSQAALSLRAQANVLNALVLRDMRTRFGGSHWGYAIAVAWPCAHIFVIVATLTLRGFVAPLGDSVLLFVASGVAPYITFMYMSRKIMEGLSLNKPLTYFPAVTLLDVILSRTIVECVSAWATLFCVFLILEGIGVAAVPVYPAEALLAFMATILVSAGMGIINANIVAYFPGWMVGYILFTIAGYSASGVFFLPDLMPGWVYDALAWNPMLQCIAWFRAAFYPGYGDRVAKLYVILLGVCLIGIGLATERLLTRHRIQGF
jgi:capsular polysaccharide transport system permease protein